MTTKRSERADRKRNTGKVAKELAVNPHATVREIAKKANIALGTVSRAKGELEQNGTKDPIIRYIVDESRKNLTQVQKIQRKFLNQVESKKQISTPEIQQVSTIGKDEMQRITVLGGNVTNPEGGLDLRLLSDDELFRLITQNG